MGATQYNITEIRIVGSAKIRHSPNRHRYFSFNDASGPKHMARFTFKISEWEVKSVKYAYRIHGQIGQAGIETYLRTHGMSHFRVEEHDLTSAEIHAIT